MIFQKSWITELLTKKDDTQVYTQKKKKLVMNPPKANPPPQLFAINFFV